MKTLEIEFKNPISEQVYNKLLKTYNLENNIFLQTNYYFDSVDNSLEKRRIVLRIRYKAQKYKVTLKTGTNQGALEEHVLISEEKALDMIQNGFNLNEFFEEDLNVKFLGKLDNYRVSMPYKDGELFVDKIIYFDSIDFEIEYEVDSYEQGEINFKQFLLEHKIKEEPFIRKSSRIYNYLVK